MMLPLKKSINVTKTEDLKLAKELFDYNADYAKRASTMLARQSQEIQDKLRDLLPIHEAERNQMVNEAETKGREIFVNAVRPHVSEAEAHLAYKTGSYFFNFQYFEEHGIVFVCQPKGTDDELPKTKTDEDGFNIVIQ